MGAWPLRLSMLAAVAAFGAVGATLALAGAGLPFLLAMSLAAAAAGALQYAALTVGWPATAPDRTAELAALAALEGLRTQTATLRHDLRGVLSPALMISDRLLAHADPAVQRAGSAVVKSIDRATGLLANNREILNATEPPNAARPVSGPLTERS